MPAFANILPVNLEPNRDDFTSNPTLGDTDAVTEPDAINVVNNASGVNAVLGISNNLAPLPEKEEPELISTLPVTLILPVNSEPIPEDSTLNPLVESTDAVIEPVAILVAIWGGTVTLINLLPSPSKKNALTLPLTLTLPVNWEPIPDPVAGVSTLNPKFGDTDAVTLPLDILGESPVNAERGILYNPLPSPWINDALIEPVNSLALTTSLTFKLPLITSSPYIRTPLSLWTIASTTFIVPAIIKCNWQL